MKNLITLTMLAAIFGLGGFMAMTMSHYRGGSLADDVRRMREEKAAGEQRAREARSQPRPERQASGRNRGNARRSQSAPSRFDVNVAEVLKGVELSEHQTSQAETIARRHRETIALLRRQQRDAQDLLRLSMLSDLLRANGGKIPDPAWNDLAPNALNDAVQAHADVSAEAREAVAAMFASWQESNQAFTVQMREARDAANGRLLELLTPEQRTRLEAATPRTAAAN